MFGFYEKAYYFELERKSKVQTALAFPISISIFSISASKFALEKVHFCNLSGKIVIFFLVVCAISLFFTFRYCLSAIGIKKYSYVPKMSEIKQFQQGLRKFQESGASKKPAKSVDQEFESYLIDALSDATTQNSEVNDLRSDALHKANRAAFVLALFSLISAAIAIGAEKHLFGT